MLPHIDEHAIVIAAGDPGRVWSALGETIERYWRVPNLGVRMLHAEPATRSGPLIADSTIPGFIVALTEPNKELALQGRHRFSSYALIFRMATNDGRTTLSAETRATFLGAQAAASTAAWSLAHAGTYSSSEHFCTLPPQSRVPVTSLGT